MVKLHRVISNKKNHLWFYLLPIIFSLIGLFFIFETSAVRSYKEIGDSFHYLRLQTIWFILGIFLMMVLSAFDYHKLYYMAFFLMIGTIGLLFLVLIPNIGHEAGGARRWFDFGFFNIQPTELAKFSTVIYLSSWFIQRERKRFLSFLFLLGLLMFLIILQPNIGTAILIFFLSIVIYFIAGVEIHYLLFLIPISLGGFYFLVNISPYRFRRLLAFFNPELDPLGITYHLNQILISLGRGGLFGVGFSESKQKYLFLPEAHTDSIFAIIAEEMGFLGSFLLILSLMFLLYLIYRVFSNASDRYGKLLAGGIFTFFNLQILINLAGMVNLIPLTGTPLPFISYGGSNLLVSFALMGILINIYRRSKIKI